MSRVPGPGQENQDVLPAVHESLHSLASLRHRHVETVTRLERGLFHRNTNTDTEGLLMRINEVKDSHQRIELGLEEGKLVIALSEYEQQLEQDQVQRDIELLKIKDENDWLREELEETERRSLDTSFASTYVTIISEGVPKRNKSVSTVMRSTHSLHLTKRTNFPVMRRRKPKRKEERKEKSG